MYLIMLYNIKYKLVIVYLLILDLFDFLVNFDYNYNIFLYIK